jgi:hypothetical protein
VFLFLFGIFKTQCYLMEEEENQLLKEEPAVEVKPIQINRVCLNCKTPLTDTFCPHCGQKNIPRRQGLGELIENFIGSFYSFESKFFKTTQYLLLRPGFLPEQYNAGKRESYYHPARAYVFVSFIFFLLFLSFPELSTSKNQNLNFALPDKNVLSAKENFQADSASYRSSDHYDSVQSHLPADKRDGFFKRRLMQQAIRLNNTYNGRMDQFSTDFKNTFLGNFPKVFFWLLPVFAFILKIIYIRRDFYYSEHLVFTIYFYNFFFLASSIGLLLGLVPKLAWLQPWIAGWILIYLFLAMKRLYKQSWRKTLAKYFTFAIMFSICMIIGLMANLVVTLLVI